MGRPCFVLNNIQKLFIFDVVNLFEVNKLWMRKIHWNKVMISMGVGGN